MKKVISIALALVMMLAICVPAFAAEISNTAPDAQDAVVKTSTDGQTGSYTVTFPAETVIVWGAEATNLQYTVSAQLGTNKTLTVTAAAKDGVSTMKDANGLTLAYTLSGDTAYTTPVNTVVTNAAKTLTVNVAADDWSNAVISEYTGYITFTAAVADA